MHRAIPMLALAACTTDLDAIPCTGGEVQTYSGTYSAGTVTIEHCKPIEWGVAECTGDPSLCELVYASGQPVNGDTNMLFGEFIFGIRVAEDDSLDLTPWGGPTSWDPVDIAAEGYWLKEPIASERYGGDSLEMIVACEHPDIDPICPFTWYRKSVTLPSGLVVDISGGFADYQDPNDPSTAPAEYTTYLEQVDGLRVTVD